MSGRLDTMASRRTSRLGPARNSLACPYFAPTQLSNEGAWIHPARLPLGAGWEGCCTAPGNEGVIPDARRLQQDCSLGYAFTCPHLPAERAWDAVRFCVSAESELFVNVSYVCERNHLPAEHGKLEYRLQNAAWTTRHFDTRIQTMAEAFLHAWLQKGRQAIIELPDPKTE